MGDEYYMPPVGGSAAFGSENRTTSLRSMEMHPFWCFTPLPPVGEVIAAIRIEMLMTYKAERRANLPFRGGKRTWFVGEQSDLRTK